MPSRVLVIKEKEKSTDCLISTGLVPVELSMHRSDPTSDLTDDMGISLVDPNCSDSDNDRLVFLDGAAQHIVELIISGRFRVGARK